MDSANSEVGAAPGSVGRRSSPRREWLWAFGLSVVPVVLTVTYFFAPELTDTEGLESTWVLQASGLVWLTGSICAAVAAGAVAGFPRALAATLLIWTALVVVTLLAWGPSCGLQMSGAPTGTAALAFTDASGVTCSDDEASRWNNALWVVLAGGFATALAAAGGLLGAAGAWAIRRGPMG